MNNTAKYYFGYFATECPPFSPALIAVVLGVVALVKIKAGTAEGKPSAIAGIACGGVAIVIGIINVLWLISRH